MGLFSRRPNRQVGAEAFDKVERQQPDYPQGPNPYVALQSSLAHAQNDNSTHFGPYGESYWNGSTLGTDINDETVVVNPREFGPTGWGDYNNQLFHSGHTQNIPTNESAEQGMGVGPERKWPHYPTPDQPNPYRNMGIYQRNGTDGYSLYIYRNVAAAYWAQAIGYELSQAQVRHRSTPYGTTQQPPSVPFVSTVTPIGPGGGQGFGPGGY